MFLKNLTSFISHTRLHAFPDHLPLGPLSRVGLAFSIFSCYSTWCSESLTLSEVVWIGSKIGGGGGGGVPASAGGGAGGGGPGTVGSWFLQVALEALTCST